MPIRYLAWMMVCSILWLGQLPAISPVVDSLKASLSQLPLDSSRIDTHYELASHLLETDPQAALSYLEAGVALSRQLDAQDRLCYGMIEICQVKWYREGNPIEAKQLIPEIHQLVVTLGDEDLQVSMHMQLASIHYLQGKYDSAVEEYLAAQTLFAGQSDSLGIAKCYNNIGNVYCNMQQWATALAYFQQAEEILSTLTNPGAKGGLGYTWGNIALVYGNTGEPDKALRYYHKSLQIDSLYERKAGIAMNLQNIGSIYMTQGEYEEALLYFEQSLALASELQDQAGILYAQHALATTLGQQGNFKEAIPKFRAVLATAQSLELLDEVKRIYLNLSELFGRKGNLDSALFYRLQYEAWHDSLVQLSHLNRIKDLELQYETEAKEKQIELLTQENRIQELENTQRANWMGALIVGLAILSLGTGLWLYYAQQRLRIQQTLSAQQEALQAAQFQQRVGELEMKALRAQMNPHFVFNCLNSINLLVLDQEAKLASRYLVKFSKLLRKILEHAEQQWVPLTEELTMIEDYIELETLRFKDKVHYSIQVDESLDPALTYIPTMTLQPLVENAIWHGLMHKPNGGKMLIDISPEGSHMLRCTVEDNGVGREEAASLKDSHPLKSRSMGLHLTEERLKLMKANRAQGRIEIEDLRVGELASGTRVNLFIPLQRA